MAERAERAERFLEEYRSVVCGGGLARGGLVRAELDCAAELLCKTLHCHSHITRPRQGLIVCQGVRQREGEREG